MQDCHNCPCWNAELDNEIDEWSKSGRILGCIHIDTSISYGYPSISIGRYFSSCSWLNYCNCSSPNWQFSPPTDVVLSCDDCLEDKSEDYQKFRTVQCCIVYHNNYCTQSWAHTYISAVLTGVLGTTGLGLVQVLECVYLYHLKRQNRIKVGTAKSQDTVNISLWCPEKTFRKATFWAGDERCIHHHHHHHHQLDF